MMACLAKSIFDDLRRRHSLQKYTSVTYFTLFKEPSFEYERCHHPTCVYELDVECLIARFIVMDSCALHLVSCFPSLFQDLGPLLEEDQNAQDAV